jgi:hypothetical protein
MIPIIPFWQCSGDPPNNNAAPATLDLRGSELLRSRSTV